MVWRPPHLPLHLRQHLFSGEHVCVCVECVCGVWRVCVMCGGGNGGMHVWCVAVGMGVCMCVVCGGGYAYMFTLHTFLRARI